MPKKPHSVLNDFHPAVAGWFHKTFEGPSPAQVKAWPVIRRGESMLLTAPTGSGKTLAAFLCAIDSLYKRLEEEPDLQGVQVLYITPLKALGNDIHRNLLTPLAEIAESAKGEMPEIRVAVRSGDTPQSERQKMVRKPPHILITTPESLYLMLGSKHMRKALVRVDSVIVDEIHAMCESKRGTHLAVSLERLEQLVSHAEESSSVPKNTKKMHRSCQRIGCSATVSPLEEVAHFLVGYAKDGTPRPCTIVDAGMRKDLDVKVVAPVADFVSTGHDALWANAYERLVEEIKAHRTTLIFCNSRYRAERTVIRLRELAGESVKIGVHHGSMAKDIRLQAEQDLKNGKLDALVATSSLELGIDVGSIDLVYQLESPKTVASGLQRIGRAGHLLHATSKGRILVFQRDELFEAAALCKAMKDGAIDPVSIPEECLDVLAQQIAGCAVQQTWQTDELFARIKSSYPYRNLTEDTFLSVLRMVAGEHGLDMARAPFPLVYWDRSVGTVTPTRGAPSITATCVGTIAESSEYEVLIEKNRKRIGRMDATFVDDTLRTGDVFVLGSNTWRVMGKRKNQIFVEEAPTTAPTVPWWLGPIVPRSPQLGKAVGELRERMADDPDSGELREALRVEFGMDQRAIEAITSYIREQKLTGIVPSHTRVLVESWNDELGRKNIIIHTPLGARINRAWGQLLQERLRKKDEIWTCTSSNDLLLFTCTNKDQTTSVTAEKLLTLITKNEIDAYAAGLMNDSLLSGAAFRETAVCSLQILRAHKSKRVPLWLQNHRAQELYECAKNHPEYPVLKEVLRGYLWDTLDLNGLQTLIADIAKGKTELVLRDVECPSPFTHSLLIQNRYTGSHQMGRDHRAHLLGLHRRILQEILNSDQMAELLDGRAISWLEEKLSRRSDGSRARDAEELAYALRDVGDVPADTDFLQEMTEGDAIELLDALMRDKRILGFNIPGEDSDSMRLLPTELWPEYLAAYHPTPQPADCKVPVPTLKKDGTLAFAMGEFRQAIPENLQNIPATREARHSLVNRYLHHHGPVSLYDLMNRMGWPENELREILGTLVDEGTVLEGIYRSDMPRPQWVNRANLEDIHHLTLKFLKRELAACAPYEVVDFITRWQHRHPIARLSGVDGLKEVIAQIQGQEIVQGAWETEILRHRVNDYSPALLDRLFATGEVCWRRVASGIKRGKLTICLRKDMPWLVQFQRKCHDRGVDRDIPETIETTRKFFLKNGNGFFRELLEDTGLDEDHAMRSVWSLAWNGELSTDTFETVRHLAFQTTLSDCYDLMNHSGKILRGRAKAEDVIKRMWARKMDPSVGRWWATEKLAEAAGKDVIDKDTALKKWTDLYLKRWGIITKDIVQRAEVTGPEWKHLIKELKRRELMGEVSRGYFIEQHQGEQFGLPEAIELLRDCRARRSVGVELGFLPRESLFCISNRDPANLYSNCLEVITERGEPWRPKARSGNLHHRTILQAGQALMFQSSFNIRILNTLDKEQARQCVKMIMGDYEQFKGPIGDHTMRVRNWNGHPIDLSPACSLLWKLGFRFDGRKWLCYPPVRSTKTFPAPRKRVPEIFHPYYAEDAPATYDRDWLISRVPEKLQPNFRKAFDLLDNVLPKEAKIRCGAHGFWVQFNGERLIGSHLTTGRVYMHVSNRGWVPPIFVTPDTDVESAEFRDELKRQIDRCIKVIQAQREKKKPK